MKALYISVVAWSQSISTETSCLNSGGNWNYPCSVLSAYQAKRQRVQRLLCGCMKVSAANIPASQSFRKWMCGDPFLSVRYMENGERSGVCACVGEQAKDPDLAKSLCESFAQSIVDCLEQVE